MKVSGSAMKILLVEDDKSLGESLRDSLKGEGYDCTLCNNVTDAHKKVKDEKFNLIVLDVQLPDGNGFELAEKIKKISMTPFLFMTAQNSAEDRLRGYELGADEFIPKPFHLKEFFLRIKHVINDHVREQNETVTTLKKKTYPHFEIDFESRTIKSSSGQIQFLPSKDFDVLKLLVESAPKVLSRDEILTKVWGSEEFPSNRTIDNVIVRLRHAIRDTDGNQIRSVRGVGYQWFDEPI